VEAFDFVTVSDAEANKLRKFNDLPDVSPFFFPSNVVGNFIGKTRKSTTGPTGDPAALGVSRAVGRDTTRGLVKRGRLARLELEWK
jgi:hypothetical protein